MKSIIWIVLGLIISVVGYKGVILYRTVDSKTTYFLSPEKIILLPMGSNLDSLVTALEHDSVILDKADFLLICKLKKFKNPKPGRYLIKPSDSNASLVNLFRSGNQSPVRVTFNNVRTMEELAGKVGHYMAFDSLEMLQYLNNPTTAESFGFEAESFSAMFIPNTYELWWTSSPEDFGNRMAAEYQKFWNASRLELAKKMKLSPVEVSTLASIVQAESIRKDEAATIAGVYVNRLHKGMLLQADPTLVYAWGDFGITRVLDKHKEIDSPYNTYKHSGLPPGPINFPDPVYIDAALHAEKHNYLYFCASPDFSGYHRFASNYISHLKNAREYQRALNHRKIYN